MPIDIGHINITVSSLESAKDFYLAALAPLGYQEVMAFPGQAYGLGANGIPDLWLSVSPGKEPIKGLHIAFSAEKRAEVDQFYDAALFVVSLF
jgi:catechol 2,3-dioxygenase-like lactoylglutathione lyase family enzyme